MNEELLHCDLKKDPVNEINLKLEMSVVTFGHFKKG